MPESEEKTKSDHSEDNFSKDQRKNLDELAEFKAEVESMEGEVKIKMIGLLKEMEELEELKKDADKARQKKSRGSSTKPLRKKSLMLTLIAQMKKKMTSLSHCRKSLTSIWPTSIVPSR